MPLPFESPEPGRTAGDASHRARSRGPSAVRRAAWLLGTVALVATVGAAMPRHTELDASSPEADAVVEAPVSEVLLTFTTPVNAGLSRIVVTRVDVTTRVDADTLVSGRVEHPPGREDQIRAVPDRPLGGGSYRVSWRALSPDGHVVEGGFAFTVDLPGQPVEDLRTADTPGDPVAGATGGGDPGAEEEGSPAGSTVRGEAVVTSGGVWIRWLQLLGAILLLGAAGARFAVLPTTGIRTARPEARARMLRGFSRFGWLAALLLLVALPLRLADQLAAIGDGAGAGEALVLLFETAWGAGWLLHLGAVTLAVLGLALTSPRGRRDRGWVIVALAALVLPLVSALQGHAWGQVETRGLAVLSLYLHVLGAGLWLGGLVLLVFVGLPAVRRRETEEVTDAEESEASARSTKPALARLVNGFSRIALPAVVLVLASGLVNAWLELGAFQPLFATGYGRTLLVKVAFVVGAMLLGFYNWRRVRPTLAERPEASALRIPASVEAVVGVIILFVTAVLVATPPP